MREPILAFVGFVAIVAAAVPQAPERVGAQARTPAPRASAPPRTPDGHPDFQGTYDVATMTPVERPTELGDRLVLTNQEAAALEQYEQQRGVKNDEPIRGDRQAPPVGGENTTPKSYLEFLEKAGGGAVGGYNNFWLAGGTTLITVN